MILDAEKYWKLRAKLMQASLHDEQAEGLMQKAITLKDIAKDMVSAAYKEVDLDTTKHYVFNDKTLSVEEQK